MRTCNQLLAVLAWSSLLAATALAADNQLTEAEKHEGWQLLFNGKDLAGWKCNNGKEIATPVQNGCLAPYKSGGYVDVYERKFEDFIFKCDVRWDAPNCNSGVFFRIEDLNNPVNTGFEVQVSGGKGIGTHAFGAIYDLASTTKDASNDMGQWNTVEIRCEGPRIHVKVNGQLVCQMNCDDYDKPGLCPNGQPHKFKLNGQPRAVKDFARAGHLGFQDHGHPVWYKNVKILDLKK